jgi:hypothetical protein
VKYALLKKISVFSNIMIICQRHYREKPFFRQKLPLFGAIIAGLSVVAVKNELTQRLLWPEVQLAELKFLWSPDCCRQIRVIA